MNNDLKYLIMFGEEYICLAASIESAIELAKHLKNSLKLQGKTGSYDIYYSGNLIAKF